MCNDYTVFDNWALLANQIQVDLFLSDVISLNIIEPTDTVSDFSTGYDICGPRVLILTD